MLKSYFGFEALTNEYKQLPIAGRIYTKPKVDRQNIRVSEYVVIFSVEIDDYIKEIGGLIPSQISGGGYYSWLESPVLIDIISLKIEYSQNASLEDIENAVFYYLENDAFMEG